MQGERLQERARERADELPGSSLGHPFGPDWDVYKVRDKVFMLMTDVAGDPVVILKADPEDARALRSTHDDITPGYHMNKKHWITLRPGGSLPQGLIDDLVTESYLLVVGKLPRARRPVDPSTFGRSPT
ncbi:MmcQ/YjbR family DNA-binding protein [Motilibacter deserti]|uniref:MmcQ/YjbR family DNA-binding protein n=1 Tax=Motilibacter deserti TaxID=2714956 RepID=A0ABX0GV41_9ACTN|nr:MmcQ/YjbR family DNA-binding protein [Motilibacter deserti]NHC14647.1 MmcQ/YjbR family DNA-binding protein [Motilibacter deserti]